MAATSSDYVSRTCDVCDCTSTGTKSELITEGWKVYGRKGSSIELCEDCDDMMKLRRDMKKRLEDGASD